VHQRKEGRKILLAAGMGVKKKKNPGTIGPGIFQTTIQRNQSAVGR